MPSSYTQPRLTYPEHEMQHSWLHLLLEAYAIINTSVTLKIGHSKYPLACKAGCSFCCAQPIPVTPLEILGIRFYLNTLACTETIQHVDNWQKNEHYCPFLVAEQCSIYEFRPIACRRYLITNTACSYQEEPTVTRPQDVLIPSRRALLTALQTTAPFYKASKIFSCDNPSFTDFADISIFLRDIDWKKP